MIALDRVRGSEALIPRVVALMRERIPERRARLRIGVVHVLCPDVGEELKSILEREFEPDEAHLRPATAVLASHTGPGAWAAVYQFE